MREKKEADLLLKVTNLTKAFQTQKGMAKAVDKVSFAIQKGEIFALLGPNGAGKTTIIKMIASIITPDAGTVEVAGLDTSKRRGLSLQNTGAVLEDNRNIYWGLTPLENIIYFASLKKVPMRRARERAEVLLAELDLVDKTHEQAHSLSRGMQQKLAVACALAHGPKLLLLDEPTLGLDFQSSDTIKNFVRRLAQSGVAILLTTHQLDVAQELSHRVGIINRGALIVQEEINELLRRFEKDFYRIEVATHLKDRIREAVLAAGGELQISDDKAHWPSTTITLHKASPSQVHQLLRMLEPLPLISVSKDKPNLGIVLKQLTTLSDAGLPEQCKVA